jgi:hypothetical protein
MMPLSIALPLQREEGGKARERADRDDQRGEIRPGQGTAPRLLRSGHIAPVRPFRALN